MFESGLNWLDRNFLYHGKTLLVLMIYNKGVQFDTVIWCPIQGTEYATFIIFCYDWGHKPNIECTLSV